MATDAKPRKKEGSVSEITSTLIDRIALLKYKPGEVLREEKLVDEFDCSRTPIRNAMILLEDKELIRRVPKSGTYVTPVNFQDLKELFKVRKHLLKLVAELLTKNIISEEIETLEETIITMSEEQDPNKRIEMDLSFHRKLYGATHNDLLEQIMRTIIVKATRIWLFSADRELTSKFTEDFSDLVNALKQKNVESVEKILVTHSQQTIRRLKKDLEDI